MNDELLALATEIMDWHDCADGDVDAGNGHFRLVCLNDSEQQRLNLRAVLREAASAIRLAAQSPEPVAWRWRFEDQSAWTVSKKRPLYADDRDVICEPLYTATPQSASDGALLEAAAKIASTYDGVNFPPAHRHANIIAQAIRALAASEATKSDGGVESRYAAACAQPRGVEPEVAPGPSDLMQKFEKFKAATDERLAGHTRPADVTVEVRAEIERLKVEADKYCECWREEHDKNATLRARVREVVGPFAEMRQALELISANKPGDELLDERAIFQTWGLKDTPTSKQITLGHLRAAKRLMEEVK